MALPPDLQVRARGEVSFNIDGHHMYTFDRTLYNWAVSYPIETGERRRESGASAAMPRVMRLWCCWVGTAAMLPAWGLPRACV